MKRPLWTIGAAYAAALLLAPLTGLNGSFLLGALCLVAFFCALAFPALRRKSGRLAALLSAAAAFCVFFGTEAMVTRPLSTLYGTQQVLEGQVEVVGDGSCVVRARGDGAIPEGTRVVLYYDDQALPPDVYDTLRAAVRILEPTGEQSLSDKAQGTRLWAACTAYGEAAMETAAPEKKPAAAHIDAVREAFRGVIRRVLPGEEGALVSAVCLGTRGELSTEAAGNFRRTGLSHLLAVSGLQLTIVAQAVLALLRFLRVPKRVSAGLAGAAVLFFLCLVGFSASVVRAGVMCLVLLLAQMVSRDADSLNSMGAALLILTLPNPYAVWDVGLQLSFAATLGLVLLAPWMRERLEGLWHRRCLRRGEEQEPGRQMPAFMRIPMEALCVTAAASVATMPIVAFVFRELSVVSPLANLLGIFPANAMLVCGCLGMALGLVPFLSWAAQGLLWLAGLLARYLLGMTDLLGGWEFAALPAEQTWLLLWLVGAPLLMWLGWRLLGHRGFGRAAALSVVAFACGLGFYTVLSAGVTSVTSLAAGDGLALLVKQDGRAGMVAASRSAGSLESAVYALREHGVRRLDFLLVPAWDEDGGIWPQLARQGVTVDRLLVAEGTPLEETARSLPAEQWDTMAGGDTFTFWDDGLLECREDGWLRLTMGDTRILVCPPGGNAATLPADWRRTHLAVFTQVPPLFSSGITAQGAVLGCYGDEVPLVTKALPWGSYPIRLTAGETDVTAMTRGLGDLTI